MRRCGAHERLIAVNGAIFQAHDGLKGKADQLAFKQFVQAFLPAQDIGLGPVNFRIEPHERAAIEVLHFKHGVAGIIHEHIAGHGIAGIHGHPERGAYTHYLVGQFNGGVQQSFAVILRKAQGAFFIIKTVGKHCKFAACRASQQHCVIFAHLQGFDHLAYVQIAPIVSMRLIYVLEIIQTARKQHAKFAGLHLQGFAHAANKGPAVHEAGFHIVILVVLDLLFAGLRLIDKKGQSVREVTHIVNRRHGVPRAEYEQLPRQTLELGVQAFKVRGKVTAGFGRADRQIPLCQCCCVGRKISAGPRELAQFLCCGLLPAAFKFSQRSVELPAQQIIKAGFNIHVRASSVSLKKS